MEKLGVFVKSATHDLKGDGTISHVSLLGQKDGTHSSHAEAADNAEPRRNLTGEFYVIRRNPLGQTSAIEPTMDKIVRKSLLACGTNFHGPQLIPEIRRILSKRGANEERAFEGRCVVVLPLP
jgi:hypothetical protein